MNMEVCLKKPSIFERLLRLLYPVKCIICDAVLREDSAVYLCSECHGVLPCHGNGFRKLREIPYCDSAFAAFKYSDGIDTAIQSMKFKHQPLLAGTLAYLLYERMMESNITSEFDAIIPVPMHPRKKRERGYNQSQLIANELSLYLGIPVLDEVLIKNRYTRPQSQLGREERIRNLDGAFSVKTANKIINKKILLVDDVVTTGTTINNCAKILYERGASALFASVIAIAEK